ncbi:hypothetical protein A2U01_0116530, partial [Trifolium medium]|nr:hypothetical protein [Trifolium medium]
MICYLCATQEWMACRASQLQGRFWKALSVARRAASYGASRTFIVHHAR